MSIDNRKALPKSYELTIAEEGSGNQYSVVITDEIGRGGSCIVYKGERPESIGGDVRDRSVVVKEFYPAGLNIKRKRNRKLDISELSAQELDIYRNLQEHFTKGQSESVEFYDYYKGDQSLPSPFVYGEANNTVYAVSDPSKGRVLSGINFDALDLNRIASIMESICDAISKIHTKRRLYLDCKPDNFFYYYNNRDLQSKVYLFDFDTIVDIDDIQKGNYKFCSASKGWIPPEQHLVRNTTTKETGYRDPQHIGYHTDIFSVGAVFFWLLTQHKPTERDLRAIKEGTFDLVSESRFCSGADIEVIDLVQDLLQNMLQIDTAARQEMFRHYLSIRIVRKQFEALYGLTAGDNVHFEPLHTKMKHIETILLDSSEQINDANTKLDDILDSIEKQTNVKLDVVLDAIEKGTGESDKTLKEILDTLVDIKKKGEKPTVGEKLKNSVIDNESKRPKKGVVFILLAALVAGSMYLIIQNENQKRVKIQAAVLKDLFLSDEEGEGWGDSSGGRASYTMADVNSDVLGKSITFNTVADGRVGNEKNFVAARRSNTSDSWSADEISVEDGEIYTICLYVNNDNPNGTETIASDVCSFFSLPTNVNTEHHVIGYLNSENSMIPYYWDDVVLLSDEPVYLEYIDDSASYTNYKLGEVKIDNETITSGIPLGFDKLDGNIPGGYDFCGIVTIDVMVHKSVTAKLAMKTRLKGTTKWKEVINANVGDEVEFQIEFQNLKAETVEDIMIRDVLPDNIEYVEDSTYLYTSNYPDGIHVEENTLTTTGINIGSYTPKSNAFVRFTGKVVDKSLTKGGNQLVNWASSTNGESDADYELYRDDVSVMVNK